MPTFSVGQRVTATRYGVTGTGTVTAVGVYSRGGVVWVRWDASGLTTAMHRASLTPAALDYERFRASLAPAVSDTELV